MTTTTGRPAAASSSSRRRVTPGRRLANPDAPHSRHTGGRSSPHRPHRNLESSESATAASHRSQRASALHARQARIRPRPGVLWTQTTRTSGRRSSLISAEDSSEDLQGSSPLRSTTSTIGHPARSASVGSRTAGRPIDANPVTLGHGEVASTGTPARLARSATTSRACHVGDRSSCSVSSCSSITTAARMPGHGAHAAARAPITTFAPDAARAHCSRHHRGR